MTSIKNFQDQDFLVPLTSSSKSHRLIILPNGLLTLLISDPSQDLGSIGLCVASGSNNDPNNIPGLAHFCEHLLLLGSKKFPQPNQFHDLIAKFGGRRNAFTTNEQTCYFFEIPTDSTTDEGIPIFNHLTEIFADGIKSPLFLESMFEREIYAIDNEHNSNKSKIGRILYHGLRLISNDKHPFHRFATGNFFSLNDLPQMTKLKVKDELINYYKQNYTSDKMTLVIRSNQSLNILQKIALQNFNDISSQINQSSSTSNSIGSKLKFFKSSQQSINAKTLQPQNKSLITDFNILSHWNNHYNDIPIFGNDQQQNCIFIQTNSNEINPTLRLGFPLLQSQFGQFVQKFEDGWCNLLGDESQGSLDDILKNKGFITLLQAYTQHLAENNDILIVELKLTNTGAQNLLEIIQLIIIKYREQFLNINPIELGKYLYELESIDLLNYLYKDTSNKSPMQEASNLTQILQQNLSNLNPKNILKGSNNWDCPWNLNSSNGHQYWYSRGVEFQKFILQVFNSSNLKILFYGEFNKILKIQDFIVEELKDKFDNYFDFNYKIGKFDVGKFDIPSNQPFTLTLHNKYIPEYALDHIKLRKIIQETSRKSQQASLSYITKSNWVETELKLYEKTSNYQIWTKYESDKIYSSRLFISFDLIAPWLSPSPENTMMTEIFVELLKRKIQKKLYSLELLNYSWEIQASLKGDVRFGFTISGYSNGISILLNLLVDEFNELCSISFKLSNDELRKARIAVRTRYNDLTQTSSIEMALAGLLVILEENVWGLEERLDALDDIDLSKFKEFLIDFNQSNEQKILKLFIQGDFKSIENYNKTINKLSHHLDNNNNDNSSNYKEPSTHFIQPGKSYNISKIGAKNDPMNAISYFIQTGSKNDPIINQFTRLFSYLISMTLIPDLRFKKQLGYAILGGTRILRSTMGIHITIMSGNFTPKYLEQKIKEYLMDWEFQFDSISLENFQIQIIEPYRQFLRKKNHRHSIQSSGGDENLISMMLPSIGSSNIMNNRNGELIKNHKNFFDYISTNSYNPNIDDEFIDKILTRENFLNFFKNFISINSNKIKSELSIFITPSLSIEETKIQLIKLQLNSFCKLKGLRISNENLNQIVENSKGNSIYLFKNLFNYFKSQGESLKLCSILLKEIINQIQNNINMKNKYLDDRGIELSENIDDLIKFKSMNPVFYL
ncbi:hypothetical protein WICMUC_002414 [Wickerhamomyces mucosus]|uniref:Uncharacterized protein n=1 Tax=Wickerhamomyces mucosus TaxID=1378264 RepID=A0A9P8PQA7_9ASCO|nr:hypothetical protein WICMUC_002414 [Wickerhamomyces mucosus]